MRGARISSRLVSLSLARRPRRPRALRVWRSCVTIIGKKQRAYAPRRRVVSERGYGIGFELISATGGIKNGIDLPPISVARRVPALDFYVCVHFYFFFHFRSGFPFGLSLVYPRVLRVIVALMPTAENGDAAFDLSCARLRYSTFPLFSRTFHFSLHHVSIVCMKSRFSSAAPL